MSGSVHAVATNTAAGTEITRWHRAILAGFAVGGVTVGTWGPRLPAIKTDLGVGTATIGLIVAAGTVTSLGGLAAAPTVMKLLGGRRAMLAAVLTVALSLALMGGATVLGSTPLVTGGFALRGFTVAMLDVFINVQGTAVERRLDRTLMPRLHAGWSGGVALGAGIGAACAELDVSAGAQMLGLACVISVCGFLIARSIPADGPAAATLPAATGWSERLRTLVRSWSDRRVLLIGLVMFGVEFGEGSANNWLTLAAKHNHGESAAVAALLFTTFAVSEALTRIFAGPVVDRIGRVWAIRGTIGLGVAGVTMFVLADSIWLLLLGVGLWAVGVSMGFPLGMSAAAEGGGNTAGRVSVAASVGYFSSLIGPPVIGVLAQSAGLLSALWLVAILFGAAAAASGSLRPLVEA